MTMIVLAESATNPEEAIARLLLAVAVVILVARVMGWLVSRIGQPPVMGEVLGGILLGPSLLGWLAPGASAYLFPEDVVMGLSAAANIGLVYFMFLIGAELDTSLLRGKARSAALISNTSVAVPFALGVGAGLALYSHVGLGELVDGAPPATKAGFVVFMGVAMSITAFPVLSRILVERRMSRHPVGVIALAAAAVDDVTAWALLAVATGLSLGGVSDVRLLRIFGLTIALAVAVAAVVRPLFGRVAIAFNEAGRVPIGWIAGIFFAVAAAAYIAGWIGVAPILGAFMVGLALPRRADLTADVAGRMHDFITIVLLPLFFVITGLKADVRGLSSVGIWLVLLGLLAIAVVGKLGGATIAARVAGLPLKEAATIGVLMNTRGLTELIVLNIGNNLGVIPKPLFTALVIVALITTFGAGPLLRLIDRRGELQRLPEEELAAVEPGARPRRAILVAPLDERHTGSLAGLASLLAASPPREVIIARVVPARTRATGTLLDDHDVGRATALLREQRQRLQERGVAARTVAFVSAAPGEDIARLARREEVDLVLLDGRRSLLGRGVLAGDVAAIFAHAPSDVAVLVKRADSDVHWKRPIVVPFSASQHDWAALELAAWLAGVTAAQLRLLGAAGDPELGRRDASRMLADTSLLVQQMTGVPSETRLVEQGRGVVEATADAGLLVVGLPDDWRVGLGSVRSELARSDVPTLFVRRGSRPGVLSPPETMTRFTWSAAGQPAALAGAPGVLHTSSDPS
jgi:Kef-type K+ transport system membrane component KefB